VVAGAGVAAAAEKASSPAGSWSATVTVNGVEVPFRFEVAGTGAGVKGWFFDGARKVSSRRGRSSRTC
jgi:hypothetical protein